MVVALMLLAVVSCGRTRSTAATPTPEPGQVTVIEVTPTPKTFDQRATLENIANTIILPWHQEMVVESKRLSEATDLFVTTPSAENLDNLQSQWRMASNAWAKLELFDFQFTMVARNQIKKWPTNVELIEELITSDEPIDDAFVASKGSHAKGLAAIEYLIFDAESTNAEIAQRLASDPSRMAYLSGLAHALPVVAEELRLVWSPEGENQIDAFIESTILNSGVEGSLQVLVHAIIVQMEVIERTKIGFPLRGDDAFARPDAVESPFAGYSVAIIEENIEAIQQLMDAGIFDYLRYLESHYDSASLVDRLQRLSQQSLDALAEIDTPLETAVIDNPVLVATAWEEVKELSRRLEVDTANHVGLVATFGVNDGD